MSETREERWRWSKKQETGHITDIVRSKEAGIEAATPDYLNALEQERDELRAKAALADEAAYNMRRHDWPLMEDGGWLARYDSLIQEGK